MLGAVLEKYDLSNDIYLHDFLEDFAKIAKIEIVSAKKMLHQEGKICNSFYFIQSGALRVFYFKDGKDITAHFGFEGNGVTAVDSFVQRNSSRYNIEAIEETNLIIIQHSDWYNLLLEKPQYEKYARIFLEQVYIELAERIEHLVFQSAKERYDNLLNQFPEIINRVSLGHIASYLGITQETLSRIRGL